jgi:hypothetical protein
MISLLIWLLVFCVVLYLVYWILGQTPLPQPIRNIVLIIIAIIAILVLLGHVGILSGVH